MRASREEKQRSHARIVAAAARRLRERGIEGTAVADVMRDAGLTHGGFYKHFASKDALVEAAIGEAFDELLAMFKPSDGPGGGAPEDVAERDHTGHAAHVGATFRARYLSDRHVAAPAAGCPAASLAGDVARGSDAQRHALGAGVRRILALLTPAPAGNEATPGAADPAHAALRELAQMVGAVVLARAVDASLAAEILAACRGNEPNGSRTPLARAKGAGRGVASSATAPRAPKPKAREP